MRRATRLVAVTGVALLLAASLPARASERSDAAARAAGFLVAHQAADGTFFGDTAAHHVAETILALVAGGADGDSVSRALGAIDAAGPEAANRAGEAGLLVMGIVAGGADPRSFGGHDYVARLMSFSTVIGAFDTQMFHNALALLGMIAAGEPIPGEAITFLRLSRCIDGGFPAQFPCSAGSGHVDATALVLNVLAGAGVPAQDALRADARSFLLGAQNADGGFGDQARHATNANSTGLALTAIASIGEDASGTPWRRADGSDPVGALLALQQVDGSFRSSVASAGDVYLATRQATVGIANRALPLR